MKKPINRIKSAQYQRNGISGRGFYAAIVENPFSDPADRGREFLIVSLDKEGQEVPARDETFAISLEDIAKGRLESEWRGDRVDVDILWAIREAVAEIFNRYRG